MIFTDEKGKEYEYVTDDEDIEEYKLITIRPKKVEKNNYKVDINFTFDARTGAAHTILPTQTYLFDSEAQASAVAEALKVTLDAIQNDGQELNTLVVAITNAREHFDDQG